jgi:transposase
MEVGYASWADFIDESNPVRMIDIFVDALDLAEMGFEGVEAAATGRQSYHPSVLLKLYIYGYMNRYSSRFQRASHAIARPTGDGLSPERHRQIAS